VPNVLHDDLEITAPKVLTTTWNRTDFPPLSVKGECQQEDLFPGKDWFGNNLFVSNPQGEYGMVHTRNRE
jgi:hypothetical protein